MVFNKELKIIITSASNSVIKKKPTSMAKTSNRQETFNDKAHDQKKMRAEETRQTESSSPHTNTTNIDIGTAKKRREKQCEMRNIQQEAERNTLKQTPNCIRLAPATFFGS
jgi:hypothetical protein